MRQQQQQIFFALVAIIFAFSIVLFWNSYQNGKEVLAGSSTSLSSNTPSSDFVVRIYKDSKVDAGTVLIPLSGPSRTVLTDFHGKILQEWPVDAARARLLSDCRLLVIHGSKEGLRERRWRELKPVIRIYSRSGDVAWEYRSDSAVHHDIHQLADGSISFLHAVLIPLTHDHPLFPKGSHPLQNAPFIRSDQIQIVTPDGKTKWRWNAHEELDTEHCGWHGCETTELKLRKGNLQWDWSHINTASPLPENHLFTEGHSEFQPGNFLVVPRHFWTVYLVSYPSGKVVWQYGGEQNGEPLLVRGHEAQMIPSGFPGAGNILLFDNGLEQVREYSRILEIDPLTKDVVWSYEDPSTFFSRGGGSMQRLQNGNTFISEDATGRIFEVTPAGEIVWEMTTRGRVSRAHRYEPGACSFS